MRAIHLVLAAENKGLELLIAFQASVFIYRHVTALLFFLKIWVNSWTRPAAPSPS
jgi:hypothetical protein